MRRKHPPASGRLNRRGPVASFAVTFEWGYADSRMGPCPDTCGCRRTCPPKPRYAPPARRFASLRRALRQTRRCSALRFSHPAERRNGTMPFARKGRAALTERLDVRVAPAGEGAAPRGSPRMPGSPSRSWSARARSVARSCRAPTPRRSESCAGSAACSRRFTSTAAAPTARRRRPPSPRFARRSTGSRAAARAPR